MPESGKLKNAKKAILKTIGDFPQRVFSYTDLKNILYSNRKSWSLSEHIGISKFIKFLCRGGHLTEEVFAPPGSHREDPSRQTRTLYALHDASDLEVAAMIQNDAYLSHWTAAYIHGLTQQIPQKIYVNKEQRPKPSQRRTSLSQEAIDRAFRNKPRVTSHVFHFRNRALYLLNGKNTKNLEVGVATDPETGEAFQATKLERTLIDIVVRPQYAGGIHEVLDAYETAARSKDVSSNVLVATLKKLDYVYPYHQAIGYYMEKAGFPMASLKLARNIPMEYDFYLGNRMEDTEYIPDWRLYVPKEF